MTALRPLGQVLPARLLEGIAPLAERPAAVRVAAAAFRPTFGMLDAPAAERTRGLVAAALAGLDPPRIVVNRSVEQGVRQLELGAPFASSLDRPGGRRHAIYGAIQFSHDLHPDGPEGVRLLNTGQGRYGEMAFVLRPSALSRATLLPNDSWYADGPAGTADDLVDITTQRVLRDFFLARDEVGFGSPWPRTQMNEVRQRFHDILALPDDQAVVALRRHVTSGSMGSHYVEARLPDAALDDVESIRLETQSARRPRWRSAEEAHVVRDMEPRAVALAHARGIPFETSSPLTPR
ncbi:MAG: hypothetical protein JWM98_1212 [Thermoleophilia bacterium]|nr:hypothetical protein [Thermoleophilia bacterium]